MIAEATGRQISHDDFKIVFDTGNFVESPRITPWPEACQEYRVASGTMREPEEEIWCKVYPEDDPRNGLVE